MSCPLDPTFTVAGTAVDFDLTSVVSRDSLARTVGWAPAESVNIEAST